MPRPPADLTGQQFNDLLVLRISGQRNARGLILYECRCKCGQIIYVTAANLLRGGIKRCGDCQRARKANNLTGRRFGRLIAQHPASPPIPSGMHGPWRWVCLCDCGNTTIVTSDRLLSGNTTSCGCAQREAVRALYTDGTAPCKLLESARPRSTNTSGITGVYYDRTRQMWAAEITFQRKKYFLGRYHSKQEAAEVRKAAEAHIYGSFLQWYKTRPQGP